MIVKRICKTSFILFVMSFFLRPSMASVVPSLSITPSSGYVAKGDEFTIDIVIDSGGEEIMKAKSVITFDPTKARIIKAQRNNALFAQFPQNEQTTDNTNGVIMLTGFTQSGSSNLYKTTTTPDVFGRITFQALNDGNLKFDWEFSGEDAPFKSVMMKDGSPPQNILVSRPRAISFTIQDIGTSVQQPKTALFDNTGVFSGLIGIAGGISLFAGSSVMANLNSRLKMKKHRTIVEYDE